ncbi:condensation domain-containing protein [Streptomyces sp. NPDC088760]|uniref:condensation domain-containing protein n=1 Tax=Streptomyces sp. NPDC088760 TaxID=3365890 RepID=UPI003807E42B
MTTPETTPTTTPHGAAAPVAAPAGGPRIDDVLGLSPLQQGLLFHAEFDEADQDAYAIQLVLRLDGPLDTAALWRAADALLQRHSSLRAAFRHRRTGEPIQVIPSRVRVPRTEHDLSGLPAGDRDAALARLADRQRTARFDLRRPPAVRFALARLGDHTHRLLLTCHHILLDGWSLPLLVDDLMTLYGTAVLGGRLPEDAGLPAAVPYRDYLKWLRSRDDAAARAHWRQALAGVDGPTHLVPGGRATGPAHKLRRALTAETSAALTRLAQGHGLTLNTVVQGAWGLLLGRLTRRDDVVFGTVVSGRPPELPGAERMVGLFINTVPVRVRMRHDEPVARVLGRLRDAQTRLLDHQHLGLAEIQRIAEAGDLFDTLLVFQNYPGGPQEDAPVCGLRVTTVDAYDATHYPVSLMAVPGDELLLDLTYRSGAAVPGGAERLLARLALVLEQMARRPDMPVGDVDVLVDEERRELLDRWNNSPREREAVLPGAVTPIGRPVPGDRAYVLGPAGELLPPQVMGELYLAGAGLARGYLNRPAMTASAFRPDPYGEPGTRMYRTGDLARWRADGQLEYLGRADHQVKIRGYRIELAEIEGALAAHPSVTGAAVLAREDTPGRRRLVAYVVARAAEKPGHEEMRRHLAALLPDYMVPQVFVWLDALPVTVHGKVDRKALPAPDAALPRAGRPPRTTREKALCAAVGDILGLADVRLDDNLFDLGCDSLTAARIVGRVNGEPGLRLTIRQLYEAPTVAGMLAGAVAPTVEDGTRGSSTAGLDTLLPMRREGGATPLFCFHPGSGLSWCYTGLARLLGPDQPLYGVQAAVLTDPGAAPGSVAAMAEHYLGLLRRVQGTGPYRLLGWSFGGVVAHAVACLLQERGEQVELLALLDSFPRAADDAAPTPAEEHLLFAEGLGLDPALLPEGGTTPGHVLHAARTAGSPLAELDEEAVAALMKASAHHVRLMHRHIPGVYEGDALAFDAGRGRPVAAGSTELWQPYVTGVIEQHAVDAVHEQLTSPPALACIASVLTDKWAGKQAT